MRIAHFLGSGVIRCCATVAFSVSSLFAVAETPSAEAVAQALIDTVRALGIDNPALDQRPTKPAQAESPTATPESFEFFETHIRPVLAEHCVQCHSGEKPKAGLRLDTREGFLAGSKEGAIIAPGQPHASKLMNSLRHDGEIKMPPAGKLPDTTIEAFAHWVAMGMPWPPATDTASQVKELTMDDRVALAQKTHWAFKPVSSPTPPAVANTSPIQSPVDAFIVAALDSKGLALSSPADKRTLIRRAYYDLIGLPPTAEEIDAFANDSAPDAYAKLVDRLLAMPQYGERWGRYWLDVARYADTRGYVFQSDPNIAFSHTYRDYVVRAFNEDLPYDQFIIHQLAADQLDLGADKRPLAAMGYLTLGRIFLGVQDDIADDRIDVVTRGLLGLTVTCARCHDHKYDPIPAADYYSLQGVFRSSSDPGEPPLITEPDPNNPDYQDYLKALGEKQQAAEELIDKLHVETLAKAREKISDYMLAAYDAQSAASEDAIQAITRDRELNRQLLTAWQTLLTKKVETHDPVFAPWVAFATIPAAEFEAKSPDVAKAVASNAIPEKPINPMIAKAFEGDAPKTMAEVAKRYSKVFNRIDNQWRDLLSARTQAAQLTENKIATVPQALSDADAEAVRLVLYGAESPANIPRGSFEGYLDVPTQGRIRERRLAISAVESTHPGRPDKAMILVDAPTPFNPYIYLRGKPENRGPEVPRQFLAVLTKGERTPFAKGSGRLELAQAIASKDNPLTARVFVNRVWLNHFGRALVDTTSDFGVRTEAPSNPELLDYLARSFMDNGWSVKHLHRLIMLSSAYQQSSTMNDAAYAVDPENKLVWRQNRKRLDFEAMRDSLLAAAGTLDLKLGGLSVDINAQPFSTRRSIYSRIDRLNFPTIFRAFDFASPDTHSPKRFRTTVPQQALFMLNSPFVVQQAQSVTKAPALASAQTPDDAVTQLYRQILRRSPDADELDLAKRFLANTTMDAPVPPWTYGYGRFDEAAQRVADFTLLPYYEPGQWRGSAQMPDPVLSWTSLTAGGGHPGNKPELSAVRRWTAESKANVAISGPIKRYSDKGDGIFVYIVSSRQGLLWTNHIPSGIVDPALIRASVEPGDTIDFVVACGAEEGFDGFEWAPVIQHVQEGPSFASLTGRIAWNASTDFTGPMPPPLTPLDQLAQVLLLTNEFMFVD